MYSVYILLGFDLISRPFVHGCSLQECFLYTVLYSLSSSGGCWLVCGGLYGAPTRVCHILLYIINIISTISVFGQEKIPRGRPRVISCRGCRKKWGEEFQRCVNERFPMN